MTALIGVECNGCQVRLWRRTWQQVSMTRIRDDAKAEGWHKTYGEGVARDICPTCWEAGER